MKESEIFVNENCGMKIVGIRVDRLDLDKLG